MSLPKTRAHELTGILGRDVFEAPPGDVTSVRDLLRWKGFRRAYASASGLFAPDDFPLQLDFELNAGCNFSCAFCPHGQGPKTKNVLSDPALFERAIDEGAEHGLVSIKLNYINEPLLHPDWFRFVEYAKAAGVLNVYFATNGSLLTERNRERAIDVGVSKMMISLDATTTETFLAVRRSRDLQRIQANILKLLELRYKRGVTWPKVRVNFLKTALNAHEADEFIERWTGVADSIGFQDQVGVPDGPTDDVADRRDFHCAFPFKMLVVDTGGAILPCCTFSGRSMPLGNIATMTLAEAWSSDRMTALRRSHINGDWKTNPVCLHCVGGKV